MGFVCLFLSLFFSSFLSIHEQTFLLHSIQFNSIHHLFYFIFFN
jgi:hypothetical protein